MTGIADMKPAEITDVDIAFGGASRIDELLPPYADLPKEFRDDRHPMCDVVNKMFYIGLNPKAEFEPREGIDAKKAGRHIMACLRSFALKHEHKIAGVAYLMHLWFSSITNYKK